MQKARFDTNVYDRIRILAWAYPGSKILRSSKRELELAVIWRDGQQRA